MSTHGRGVQTILKVRPPSVGVATDHQHEQAARGGAAAFTVLMNRSDVIESKIDGLESKMDRLMRSIDTLTMRHPLHHPEMPPHVHQRGVYMPEHGRWQPPPSEPPRLFRTTRLMPLRVGEDDEHDDEAVDDFRDIPHLGDNQGYWQGPRPGE
jgi:hypothetical protein